MCLLLKGDNFLADLIHVEAMLSKDVLGGAALNTQKTDEQVL
jgi:hypothetical protein